MGNDHINEDQRHDHRNVDRSLRELASRQHGLLTKSQARQLGFTWAAVDHRVRSGALAPVGENVLRISGSPETSHQFALAAVLDAGGDSALTRESAAAAWGLPGFDLLPAHVVRGRREHRDREHLGILHTSLDIDDRDITVVDGIRTTTPVRTLCDLAGELHPKRLEWLCDRMWSRHLLDGAALHGMVRRLAGRGRPGSTALRQLLEERPLTYRPPESGLESRLNHLLLDDGQARMERQVDVGGTFWIGRVDMIDRAARLIVEVQSELFHGSLSDQQRDKARRSALRQAGWTLIEVWDRDIWHHGQRVVRRIAEARAAGRADHARPHPTGERGPRAQVPA